MLNMRVPPDELSDASQWDGQDMRLVVGVHELYMNELHAAGVVHRQGNLAMHQTQDGRLAVGIAPETVKRHVPRHLAPNSTVGGGERLRDQGKPARAP